MLENLSYCSDKYQYTMGKSFYDCGKAQQMAVFNLFYRRAPEHNNWAVVSGTDEVLEMVAALGGKDEAFFEKFLPGAEYKEFRRYLSEMKFTGQVYAMKEGEIVFPSQPIVIVEAPLVEAQVLETPMLCIMNHQMAVATKASRVCRATQRPVSEFGSRRAHGPWAAIYGAKAAIIAGCANSSNVLTGMYWDYGSTGTMAHSYVTAFGCSAGSEKEAFDRYIKSHKGEPLIMLIDTYDTLKCGIFNAMSAFRANGIDDSYQPLYGVRLDSGDLAYLSVKVREILDKNGFHQCKIFATNSLDEYLIADLERQGACIDSYGVGDAIATSNANPCFGNVYKLVQIDGEPVLKRSEDRGKLINPGFQITYRILVPNEKGEDMFAADVTCLRGDSLSQKIEDGEAFTICDEHDRYKMTSFKAGGYKVKPLQIKMIENGVRIVEQESLQAKKAYYNDNLSRLSPSERRLINPHYYKVDISDDLYNLKSEIIERLVKDIQRNYENEISR